MVKIVTSGEMQEIDRKTIEGYGIAGAVLMERAGVAVASRVRELFGQKKALVLAGEGNNGGDGLVAARELLNNGCSVRVLMTGKRTRMGDECKARLVSARKVGVPVEFRVKPTAQDLHGAILVDAVFGTGLSKPVSGELAEAFRFINESSTPVVAVDIPSGVSADTGEVLGASLRAAATVTFGAPKRGHLLYPGAGMSGRLFVEDIGFPKKLFDNIPCTLLEKKDMALLLPRRPAYSHKGDFGHVLVVAGSKGKTGAALMAAGACLRAGAGMVTMGVPESLSGIYQGRVTEEMVLPLPETGGGGLSTGALDAILEFLDQRADILALGPGLGRDPETTKLVRSLVTACTEPLVIDADGLNALAGVPALFAKAKAPLILTPHPGEFSRLTGLTTEAIEADRPGTALEFAKKAGVYLILKGVPTIIAEPQGELFFNSTGNPGLAKAGTGDVLTGMVAACFAQGLSPLEASLLGVYLHGLAGDVAASDLTEYAVTASEVINALPGALKCLREDIP